MKAAITLKDELMDFKKLCLKMVIQYGKRHCRNYPDIEGGYSSAFEYLTKSS
jgi:hypothetical protein